MIKKVKIPIFFGTLVLIQEDSLQDIKGKYSIPEDTERESKCYDAMVYDITEKSGYVSYVLAVENPTKIKVLSHEITHVTSRILRDRGIVCNFYDDETMAYLNGWIMEKCVKYFTLKELPESKIGLSFKEMKEKLINLHHELKDPG